ncbi:vascular endothelial growth factor receptor kdr-like [Daphnia pulicaria]|uniref:vascular endothelial growth factor receptor kdr-like n=1 Tax=Daphnia pulicaria TaxID=35523 RepID=UPI001EEB8730|nr:vascular endothelial growth factor receptor kdr-like [Daphnia pulicaria]
MNDEFTIEEQICQLPYDRRWEFPRNRLKLGKQIGAGCFGRVLKSEAVGVKNPNDHSVDNTCVNVKTVAVKMVKSETDIAALEALVSEMKILIYIGSHLNVVNLLGTCTKRIHRGELLVIVEYCRFCNLQSYLIRHRNHFINQLDEFGNLKTQNDTEDMSDTHFDTQSQTGSTVQNSTGCDSNETIEMSNLDISFNKSIVDSEEPKPLWQCQQDVLDNADSNESISTRDLISYWAFQVAQGMEYLAEKKVLHGESVTWPPVMFC